MITMHELEMLAKAALQEPVYPNTMYPPSLYYRFLKLLAKKTRPQLSVVLGVCGGGDCLHLCLGHREGKVIGIDVAYDHPVNILNIRKNFPNFEFVLGDSIDSIAKIVETNMLIDILFIDTIHTYDRTMAEFNAWYPMMRPGGVVCLDDLFRDNMIQAWNELPGQKARFDHLHIGGNFDDGGFGAIII